MAHREFMKVLKNRGLDHGKSSSIEDPHVLGDLCVDGIGKRGKEYERQRELDNGIHSGRGCELLAFTKIARGSLLEEEAEATNHRGEQQVLHKDPMAVCEGSCMSTGHGWMKFDPVSSRNGQSYRPDNRRGSGRAGIVGVDTSLDACTSSSGSSTPKADGMRLCEERKNMMRLSGESKQKLDSPACIGGSLGREDIDITLPKDCDRNGPYEERGGRNIYSAMHIGVNDKDVAPQIARLWDQRTSTKRECGLCGMETLGVGSRQSSLLDRHRNWGKQMGEGGGGGKYDDHGRCTEWNEHGNNDLNGRCHSTGGSEMEMGSDSNGSDGEEVQVISRAKICRGSLSEDNSHAMVRNSGSSGFSSGHVGLVNAYGLEVGNRREAHEGDVVEAGWPSTRDWRSYRPSFAVKRRSKEREQNCHVNGHASKSSSPHDAFKRNAERRQHLQERAQLQTMLAEEMERRMREEEAAEMKGRQVIELEQNNERLRKQLKEREQMVVAERRRVKSREELLRQVEEEKARLERENQALQTKEGYRHSELERDKGSGMVMVLEKENARLEEELALERQRREIREEEVKEEMEKKMAVLQTMVNKLQEEKSTLVEGLATEMESKAHDIAAAKDMIETMRKEWDERVEREARKVLREAEEEAEKREQELTMAQEAAQMEVAQVKKQAARTKDGRRRMYDKLDDLKSSKVGGRERIQEEEEPEAVRSKGNDMEKVVLDPEVMSGLIGRGEEGSESRQQLDQGEEKQEAQLKETLVSVQCLCDEQGEVIDTMKKKMQQDKLLMEAKERENHRLMGLVAGFSVREEKLKEELSRARQEGEKLKDEMNDKKKEVEHLKNEVKDLEKKLLEGEREKQELWTSISGEQSWDIEIEVKEREVDELRSLVKNLEQRLLDGERERQELWETLSGEQSLERDIEDELRNIVKSLEPRPLEGGGERQELWASLSEDQPREREREDEWDIEVFKLRTSVKCLEGRRSLEGGQDSQQLSAKSISDEKICGREIEVKEKEVEELRNMVKTFELRLREVDKERQELHASLSAAQSQEMKEMEGVKSSVEEVIAANEQLRAEIAGKKEELAEAALKIIKERTDREREVKELRETESQLRESLQEISRRLDGAISGRKQEEERAQQGDDRNSEVAQREKEVEELQGIVRNLRGRLVELEGEVSGLSDDVEEREEAALRLLEEVHAKQEIIDEARDQVHVQALNLLSCSFDYAASLLHWMSQIRFQGTEVEETAEQGNLDTSGKE
ncbi:hypothetical protein CBR_g8147 [Chara braunii]|uniref:Uncharacterized protein n=1 Tax=Chara braunii TaxID=69332 RepID=A0A388KLD5_CHABU|nr:hypothetical protein CBR_g8147 [Chara braunii]|eukprot:GBG70847.1 hypothetical protein CBR_g8147 [Chara braunii]